MDELKQMKCEACQRGAPTVTAEERRELHVQVPEWNFVEQDEIRRLERSFVFADFVAALRFTNAVGALAEEEGHHPALLTEWGGVTVTWWDPQNPGPSSERLHHGGEDRRTLPR